MSGSFTKAFGLSMVVCLLAIMAAPALAADPPRGRPAFPASRGMGTPGLPGRGMQLLSSLQLMGIPVVGPLAALCSAGQAIRRFIFPLSRVNPVAFSGNPPEGLSWTANRSALPGYHAFRGAAPGAMAIGFAENLTASLGGKGYNVSDLNGALSDARTALAGGNTTAFGSAMRSFRRDLGAKVAAGTIGRMVIEDYLKTLTGMHPAAGARGFPLRGMRIQVRRGR